MNNIINPDDRDYYDGKLYEVGIWPGAGYQLTTFKVYAAHEQEALELVVADAELNNENLLMSIPEMEEYIAENWSEECANFMQENEDRDADEYTFAEEYLNYIYVDATMQGASQPYFVNGENLSIREISENDKVEESKEIKEEARLTDYLGILQIRDILQKNPETADKEFAILDNMKVEVGTGDNVKIYKATKNADEEWELTETDKKEELFNNDINLNVSTGDISSNLDLGGLGALTGLVASEEEKECQNKLVEDTDNEEHIIWDSEIDYYDEDYKNEIKDNQYQDYLDNFEPTIPEPTEPLEFEEWYENYIETSSYDDWDVLKDDLENNILPAIDSQMNYNCLILSGYYGSNYPDFKPSGNGGKMFEGIDDFENYMSRFDRTTITTQNGILGSSLYDHDGTVSGEFYTLPENLTELVKAMNYETYVDIPEEITDEKEIFETVMDQFEEDLVYGNVDVRDLTEHIDLLVPIKDTISGYTPDEPKENKTEALEDNSEPITSSINADSCKVNDDIVTGSAELVQYDGSEYNPVSDEFTFEYNRKDKTIKVTSDNEKEIIKDLDEKEIMNNIEDNILPEITESVSDDKLEKTESIQSTADPDKTITESKENNSVEELLDLLDKVNITNKQRAFCEFTGISRAQLNGSQGFNERNAEVFIPKVKEWLAKNNQMAEAKEIEYISRKEYDEMPEDYKTTIEKTLQARQAVGDNVDELRNLYKNLGYEETDPMIMVNDNGGTVLKPVKIQEEKEITFVDKDDILATTTNGGKFEIKLDDEAEEPYYTIRYTDKDNNVKEVFGFDTVYNSDEEAKQAFKDMLNDNEKYTKLVKSLTENKSVKIKAYGKIYYEFPEDEWNNKSKEEREATIVDTADQATEEEGHIVEHDEVEIITESKLNEDEPQEETLDEAINRAHQEEISAINTYDTILSKTDETTDTKLVDMIEEIKADEEDHKLLLQHYIETGEALTDDELKELKDKSSEQLVTSISEAVKDKDKSVFEIDYANDDLLNTEHTKQNIVASVKNWLGNLANQVEVKVVSEKGPAGGSPIVQLIGNKEQIGNFLVNNYNAGNETIEDIYNLHLIKEEKEELDSSTITEELNTGVLPIVAIDMYSLSDSLNEYDITQEDLDEIAQELAPKYIEDTLREILSNVSVVTKSVYHPRQYNFEGDELEFSLTVDKQAYETLKENALNNPEFTTFLKDNYSSRSGFISSMADNIDEFKQQPEWKQMVQVIMFNVPDDKIQENNDHYVDEFLERVSMTAGPAIDESKSLTEDDNEEPEFNPSNEVDDEAMNTEFKVGDVVEDLVDGDTAIVEAIPNTADGKYTLRFVSGVCKGDAYYYQKGRFTMVTDEDIKREALEIYNANMKPEDNPLKKESIEKKEESINKTFAEFKKNN